MGGLEISPSSEVIGSGKAIPGLFAAGEVCGGIHGENRLGGSSLLDCVVFGRVAGASASKYLLSQLVHRGVAPSGFSAKVSAFSGVVQTCDHGEL